MSNTPKLPFDLMTDACDGSADYSANRGYGVSPPSVTVVMVLTKTREILMAVIDVRFDFVCGPGDCFVSREIEVTGGLMTDIDDCMDEILEELNADIDEDDGQRGEWEFVEYEVEEWDEDYAAPSDFRNLDEYGEHVEKCEEHGEGYRLRYSDIGDFEFDDQYNGCWDSAEDFIREQFESCHDIPDHLANYIDWESITRDWMMDYSEYEGSEGTHIFRDC